MPGCTAEDPLFFIAYEAGILQLISKLKLSLYNRDEVLKQWFVDNGYIDQLCDYLAQQ